MEHELEYGEYPFKLSLHQYDLKGYKELLKKMGESTVGSKPELYMRLKNRMEADWDEKVRQDEEIGYAKQMGLPMPVFVKPAPPKKQRKPRAKKVVKELGIADRERMTLSVLKEHARKYGLKVSGTKPVLMARIDEYLKKIDYDPESDTEIPVPIVKDKNERMTLSRMPLKMLKDLCRSNELKVSGTKPVLIDRLIEFLNRTPIKMEDIPELVRNQKDVARKPKLDKPKLKSKSMSKPTTTKPIQKPVVPIFVEPLEESIPTNIKKKPIIIKRVVPIEEAIPSTEPVNKGIVINRPKVVKNIPKDINPTLDKLLNDIEELHKSGSTKPTYKFAANNDIPGLMLVAMLEKYGNPALITGVEYKGTALRDRVLWSEMPIGITIGVPPKYKGDDLKIDYKALGIQLQSYKDIDVICIPFNFVSKIYESHANMLVYRPKLRSVEHFEPNGSIFGYDGIIDYIKRGLTNLFEKQLTPWIGPVTYIGTNTVCPKYTGLQRLSGDGGCMLWSMFAADFALANPTLMLSEMVPKILEISKEDRTYVRNIFNGYVFKTEQIVSELLGKEVKFDKSVYPISLQLFKDLRQILNKTYKKDEPTAKPTAPKPMAPKPMAPKPTAKPTAPVAPELTVSQIKEQIAYMKALESISDSVDESKLSPEERTLRKLRRYCFDHGLPITGSKRELIKRINTLVNTPSKKGILDTLKSEID